MLRSPLTVVSLFVLVLLAMTPAASAHLPEAEALEDPEGQASLAGFLPSIVPVQDGDRLTWSSVDVPHTFTEGIGDAAPAPCVDVQFSTVAIAGATFTLTDGVLAADDDVTDDDAPLTCQTATTGQGMATMGFYCAFHPWMNGLLVVYDPVEHSEAALLNDPAILLQRDAAAGASA